MQGCKRAREFDIFIEDMKLELGTIVVYGNIHPGSSMEDPGNLAKNFGEYNAIIVAIMYARRGDGTVRRVYYLLGESGMFYLVEDWEVRARNTKAEQKRDGLMASACGARFSFRFADVDQMARRDAKRGFVAWHSNNLEYNLQEMHPPELCAVRVCDEDGMFVPEKNVGELLIGSAFEYLAAAWAEGVVAGVTPIARMDEQNVNILWGVSVKDNYEVRGMRVSFLSPWEEDIEKAEKKAASSRGGGGGALVPP